MLSPPAPGPLSATPPRRVEPVSGFDDGEPGALAHVGPRWRRGAFGLEMSPGGLTGGRGASGGCAGPQSYPGDRRSRGADFRPDPDRLLGTQGRPCPAGVDIRARSNIRAPQGPARRATAPSGPVAPPRHAMPAHHRRGLHDQDVGPPDTPALGDCRPETAIRDAQPRTTIRPRLEQQLLPHDEVLHDKVPTRSAGQP